MTWFNFNPQVHWPFSGSVTQDIHPSLLAKAGNDEVELRTLREVASYGKQIGVLSDLLLAVVAQLKPGAFDNAGRHALAQLRDITAQVQRLKDELQPLPDTPQAAQALVDAVRLRFPELR